MYVSFILAAIEKPEATSNEFSMTALEAGDGSPSAHCFSFPF